jgi:hypothetical protein
MPVGLVVVIVVLAVILALVLVGALGNRRHRRSHRTGFHLSLHAANRALAHAHAEDRGWDRGKLEEAAQRELAEYRPGETVVELHLLQILDRPGVEADRAVFGVRSETGESRLTLGRREQEWVLVELTQEPRRPAAGA